MTVTCTDQVVHVRTDMATPADQRSCAAITGEAGEHPLGFAFVLALRALIDWGALPPGAIMLGHRATWHEAPGAGEVRTEISIALADPPRTRYQRVVIGYRTYRTDDERLVLEQQQEVLWPSSA